jgi:NAD+ kinase
VALDGVPVLGVNLGHLGFLTSASPGGAGDGARALARGRDFVEERMALEVYAESAAGEPGRGYVALNDAVLHKGGAARVIRSERERLPRRGGHLQRRRDHPRHPHRLHGLLALRGRADRRAVGGLHHRHAHLPHTLGVRPLVLPADETVTVEVLSPSEELVLTIDGQEHERLVPGQRVVVRRAPDPVCLVRFPGQTFFSTLRRKLRWGDLEERG